MLSETLLLLCSSSAAISSRDSEPSCRYRSAKMRPCCWVRIPEVAAAAPIPSTKLAVVRSMVLLGRRAVDHALAVRTPTALHPGLQRRERGSDYGDADHPGAPVGEDRVVHRPQCECHRQA